MFFLQKDSTHTWNNSTNLDPKRLIHEKGTKSNSSRNKVIFCFKFVLVRLEILLVQNRPIHSFENRTSRRQLKESEWHRVSLSDSFLRKWRTDRESQSDNFLSTWLTRVFLDFRHVFLTIFRYVWISLEKDVSVLHLRKYRPYKKSADTLLCIKILL